MSSAGQISERYRAAARAGGLFVLAIGVCALAGWIAGVDVLRSIVPGQVTMKVNTAICFVAAGAALRLLSADDPGRSSVRAVRCVGAAVAVLAAAVFSQYVTGHDLGIDQLLFHEDAGATGTAHPNRMAPNTALAFVFSGAALALRDLPIGRRSLIAPILAGMVTTLALLALLGYASGVTSFYGVSGVTQMAVPTTLGFIALGLGLFLARPELPPMRLVARDTPGGAMLRRLLPAVVLVPLTLGGLRVAGQHAGLYDTQIGIWLSVVAIISLALPLIWRMARSVDNADEHRRHAETLVESEARTRKIVETAHDAFISIDDQGNIAAWNPAAERLFGWTAAEAIGREVAMLVPERLRPGHINALQRALASPFSGETVRLHRDGHEIPVDIAVASAQEADGGWVFNGFLRDISERQRAHEELRAAQHEVLHRLAVAAEYRDDDTGQHTRRVGDLSARLASGLGLPDQDVDLIRRAAPLHDVGKIGISDAILLKPGRLTAAEFEQVKTHTLIGADMLAGRGFPLLETAERIARSHHERWDGTGYPYGLAGPDIPLAGRIVALADVFDALTHDRPYKTAWSIEDALAEINAQRGRQFDPQLVDTFLALCPTPPETHTPGRTAAAPHRVTAAAPR